MITGFVLSVLEQVLGSYISDVMLRGTAKKRRTEVIAAVRDELHRSGGLVDDVAALQLAVSELDLIVDRAKALEWREGELAVYQRALLTRKRLDPQEAIRELQASVEQRRGELGLATALPTADFIDPALEPPRAPGRSEETVPAAKDSNGSWRSRVLALEEEVIRERRTRSKD